MNRSGSVRGYLVDGMEIETFDLSNLPSFLSLGIFRSLGLIISVSLMKILLHNF